MNLSLASCAGALILLVAAASSAQAAAALPADSLDIVPLKKATIYLYEDFESTDPGKIPKGFTSKGSVQVVDDVAHDGKHALRLNAAVSGARQIVWAGPQLAAMGGQHWGRLFYKVQACPRRCPPAAACTRPSSSAPARARSTRRTSRSA